MWQWDLLVGLRRTSPFPGCPQILRSIQENLNTWTKNSLDGGQMFCKRYNPLVYKFC